MKVFDCFTFYNELDLLEIRLSELYPVVDHFVLAEANVTYTNNSKRMIFAENREYFRRFQDKLIYVAVDDMPRDTDDPWTRSGFSATPLYVG